MESSLETILPPAPSPFSSVSPASFVDPSSAHFSPPPVLRSCTISTPASMFSTHVSAAHPSTPCVSERAYLTPGKKTSPSVSHAKGTEFLSESHTPSMDPQILGDPGYHTMEPQIMGDLGSHTMEPQILGDPGSHTMEPQILGDVGSHTMEPQILGDVGSHVMEPQKVGDIESFNMDPQTLGDTGGHDMDPQSLGDAGSHNMKPQTPRDAENDTMSPQTLGDTGSHSMSPQTLGDTGSHTMSPQTLGDTGSHTMSPQTLGDTGSHSMSPQTLGDTGSHSMSPQTLGEPGGQTVGGQSLGERVGSPSDCDSDVVDLMKVMKRSEDPPDGDVVNEDLIATDEDDDEDDDFLVHFAHTGRKTSEMAAPPELLTQITELQEAVVGMKGTLTEAVTRLSTVVEDPSLAREVHETRQRCDDNTAEVLKLVLSLKADITSLQKDVASVSERQETLQTSVTQLLEDRRLLVSDLSQAGVISIHTRSKLEGRTGGTAEGVAIGPGRTGSGSHSNDSGVALLLERAHQAFTADHTPSPTPTNHRASDQDSLPEQPSLLVPPSVYDYVAGLRSHAHPSSSSHSVPPHSESTHNRQSVSATVGGDSEDLGLVYDSDSSLTIAANKTISLSTSLSQQCGIELRTAHNMPPTHDHHHAHSLHHNRQATHDHSHARSDSDGSDQSRDAKHSHRHCSHDYTRESNDPYTVVVTRSRTLLTDPRDPREAQRCRVARELLDTEKKYCKTLWTIQDTFAEPLKKAGILSHKDITTLFPEEVYQLYDKHCLLQHQLRERLASWKWQPLVGDIVSRFTDPRHTDVLRLYTAYVNDFPEVLKTFHKLCRTSQPFTKFIKACLEQPACGGLDLGAFLLTPVQRVPRYILLMKQLLKYTDSQHPDYQHLHSCLDRLRDFLARLNDSMEHSFQLVHAQLSPHGPVPGSSHHHPPPPPPPPSSHHRTGRSPRRSSSSIGSPPVSPSSPTYSPDRPSLGCSPERRQRSPSCSHSIGSPQRSHSNATQPSCRPRSVFLDNRSSSLPRGSASSSSGSRESASSPNNELPRIRSRSESVASRRPLPSHTHHPAQSLVTQDVPRSLAPAHSVVDVTVHSSPSHESGRWEDLAASEPSLNDPRPSHNITNDATRPLTTHALTSAHSVHSVDGQQKLTTPAWTESSLPDDPRSKKKSSIRTSLKNMFTFKKRYVHQPHSSSTPPHMVTTLHFNNSLNTIPHGHTPSHLPCMGLTTPEGSCANLNQRPNSLICEEPSEELECTFKGSLCVLHESSV
ncbi:uncharacterized protein [Panulirus ornatus]|uniref:uncharacterized protein isoform X2 n=1 Tax=Panulirus ornatus TaxID=150431 RepID=UPI003A8B7699